MWILSEIEVQQASGGGWFTFLLPIAVGFAIGGPAGAIFATGGVIAQAGANNNFEHLHEHNQVPTIDQIVNR